MATPTPTACDPNASYPVLPLPSGAFDLVGYGKDNPTGPASGGAGGPTTTINAASTGAYAALILAVTVSIRSDCKSWLIELTSFRDLPA